MCASIPEPNLTAYLVAGTLQHGNNTRAPSQTVLPRVAALATLRIHPGELVKAIPPHADALELILRHIAGGRQTWGAQHYVHMQVAFPVGGQLQVSPAQHTS